SRLRFQEKHYYQVLALVFAVEEINKDPNLLPNTTLGFNIFDTHNSDVKTLESSLMSLSGQRLIIPNYQCEKQGNFLAVIGGPYSELIVQMASVFELYKFPQVRIMRKTAQIVRRALMSGRIACGPFDPILNDKVHFPSVYQLAPKDSKLALGMVRLMLHFNWTWVGLLVTDNTMGETFLWDIREEMTRKSICVTFIHKIPPSDKYNSLIHIDTHKMLHGTSANVIILYGTNHVALEWKKAKRYYLNYNKVCITTSQWDFSMTPKGLVIESFSKSLIFSSQRKEIPSFKPFLMAIKPVKYPEDFFLNMFWNSVFQCPRNGKTLQREDCSHNSSLKMLPSRYFDVSM
ncbi:vomeronasal type-2 receptor 26-like, partial [Phascolarctos cinereus]